MATDVIPLPGSIAEDIAAKLEELAALARTGRFLSIAVVAVTPNDETFTASLGGNHLFALVGALELAKLELLKNSVIDDE